MKGGVAVRGGHPDRAGAELRAGVRGADLGRARAWRICARASSRSCTADGSRSSIGNPSGRLVTRVTNDIDAILELFASGALNAVVDLIKLVGIVVVMVSLDWRLSLIGFAAAPLVAVLVHAGPAPLARGVPARSARKTAQMNANMNEQVSGMAVVQAFCREDAAAARVRRDQRRLSRREHGVDQVRGDPGRGHRDGHVPCVSRRSSYRSAYRPVSFGTVVAFNAYLLMFFEPDQRARAALHARCRARWPGAERVFGLLGSGRGRRAERDDAAPRRSRRPARAFAFEHVTFEYKPGVPVLEDVTLLGPPRREGRRRRPDRRRARRPSRRCSSVSTRSPSGVVRVGRA